MTHRRLASTKLQSPSHSTLAMARRNTPTEQASTSSLLSLTSRINSQATLGTTSRLGVGPILPPAPSPSKDLDHPIYGPGSSILRAQQDAAAASYSSSSVFAPEPLPKLTAEFEFDEDDDDNSFESSNSGSDTFPSIAANDYGARPPPVSHPTPSGSLASTPAPKLTLFPSFPHNEASTGYSSLHHPNDSRSSSGARPSQFAAGVPHERKDLSTRLAALIRTPPLGLSRARRPSSSSPPSSRLHLSPRTLGVILLVLAVFGLVRIVGSNGEDAALKEVHLDASVLGSGGVDYARLIEEIRSGTRTPTVEEARLVEMDRLAAEAAKKQESKWGVLGQLVENVVGKSPVRSSASKKKAAAAAKKKGKGKKVVTVSPPPAAKKKPTGKSNILGLDQIPRRYRYGANFQPQAQRVKDSNSQDTSQGSEENDEENDNAMVSAVPTDEQLAAIFAGEKERYEEEEPFWRSFVWSAPPVHETLLKFTDKLDAEDMALRGWIRDMRTRPLPKAKSVGLAAMGPMHDAASPPPADVSPPPAPIVDDDEDEHAEIEISTLANDPADPEREYNPATEPGQEGEARRRVPRLGKRLNPDDNSASAKVRARSKTDKPRNKGSRAPLRDIGPVDFVGGSLVKWGVLMQESKEELGGTCQGVNWLHEYQTMHEEMLSGERPAKFISYHCERGMNCGGLGDRLLGMTSAFFFGLITNRAFLAEWQTPIPLDVVFDSPFIDWSHSSFTSDQHPVLASESLTSADLDIIHFDKVAMDMTFGSTSWSPGKDRRLTKGMEMRDLAFQADWIHLFTNRGMVYRSFSYSHLQNRISALKLKPLNAFSCILNYLFRPKPTALAFIADYTSVFSLPSVFSVGIQIRTGDASMKDADYDATNTVDIHSSFFKCADQLADTYKLPDQKVMYYLVTDSAHLRSDAIKKFGDRIVVTGAAPEHIHQKSGHADGVFNAVLEDWILAKTDYRVITQDSGFGKLATFASGQKSTTVSIFPSQNLDVVGLQSKSSHVKVDCRLESAFSSFDDLSNEWSLG